jgi:hypothetical protein
VPKAHQKNKTAKENHGDKAKQTFSQQYNKLMPGLLPSKSGSDSQSKQNRNTKRASAKTTDVKKSNRTEKVTAS